MPEPRIAVVGATGAVGAVTLQLLRERGYQHVRGLASARSAGKELEGGVVVEEATPEVLAAGDIDLAFFSAGTGASRELVPHAVRGGAVAVDKSAAYRLQDGIPLVVPEVNGERALEHEGIVANPNCCAIPLTMALKPLHDAAGLARVRVPVLVGHAEAVWVETEEALLPEDAARLLGAAAGIRLDSFPTPRDAVGVDEILVGRIRRDPTVANGLALFVVADNLRKGAALNAIQIAELLLQRRAVAA